VFCKCGLLLFLVQFGVVLAAEETKTVNLSPVSEALILAGTFFLLAAALGMLRFPDPYTRLHAATKLVTLGGLGIFGGAALAFAPAQATGRVVLVATFFLLTAPLSGYMIAHAAYLRGIKPFEEDTSVDEWGACGAEVSELVGRD
jgi:multicomponent Na+:H+ antiporter subunit G